MNKSNPLGGPPQRPEFDPYLHTGSSGAPVRGLYYLIVVAGIGIVCWVGWSFWRLTQVQPVHETASTKDGGVPTSTPPLTTAEVVEKWKAATSDNADGVASYDEPSRYFPNDQFKNPPPSTFRDIIVHGEYASYDASGKLDWNKSRQRQFVGLSDKLLKECEEWQSEINRWNSSIAPLMSNSDGKLLAADPETLRDVRSILARVKSGQPRLKEVQQQRAELTKQFEQALGDSKETYLPPPIEMNRLENLLREAEEASQSYRNAREQIEMLLTVRRNTAKRSDKSLAEMIADQTTADQAAAISTARKQLEASQREAAEKVIQSEGKSPAR